MSASPIAVVREAGRRAGFDEAHMVAAETLEHAGVVQPDVERPIPYGPGKVRRLRERIGDRPLYAAFGDNALLTWRSSPSRASPSPFAPSHALEGARAGEVKDLVELSPDS